VTISADPTEISYSSDGITAAFDVPFPFDTSADLKVTLTDSSGDINTVTTGFAVTGGAGSTGTVTFSPVIASGYTITIADDLAFTQTTDYTDNDAFPAESHEKALDRVTRITKRLYQMVKRSIRTADGDPISDNTIGSVDNRKGKYLFFNAVTGAIEYAVALATTALSQSIIGQLLWPQTSAESTASVTPVNYGKFPSPWKDISRFVSDNTGVTDVTTGLTNAFKAEKNIVVPEGTYLYSGNFLPSSFYINVYGVPQKSIFKCAASFTTGLLGVASSHFDGISIDGSLTTNAIGLLLGNASGDYISLFKCEAKNFAGANGINLKIVDSVSIEVYRSLFTGGGTNVRIKGSSNSTPTTVNFRKCRFATSTVGPGVYVETANLVALVDCISESNTQEGVLLLPANNGTIKDFIMERCWLEANYANNTAKYHVRIGDGTAIGTAKITATLRDVFFNVSAGATCKSLLADGSAVQDVLVDNPRFPTGSGSGEIKFDHSATCRVANFPYDKTYATLVSDTTKTTIAPDGVNTGTAARTSFTEVLGGGSITSTYRFTNVGRRCKFTVSIVCAGGATIASVANTSFLTLTGAPLVTQNNVANTLRADNASSLGAGLISPSGGATTILTPAWAGVANASYLIQGEYEF
jgi:hypothetical protein